MARPTGLPLAAPTPLALRGGRGGAALAPTTAKGSWWRWVRRLVLGVLLLLGLGYVLGRTVEPVRQRLERIPLAGEPLFGEGVWPILWNRPPQATEEEAPPAPVPALSGASLFETPTVPGLTPMENDLATRLAEVTLREAAVGEREALLQAQEEMIAEQLRKSDQLMAETLALKARLEGQLKGEQDRVAVVKAMKSSAATQLFGAMSDEEAVAMLKYLTPEEAAKILSGMEAERSLRILRLLTGRG